MEEDQEDAVLKAVVARADALMQRRRQPASQGIEAEDLPVLTEVVDPDADVPVLTAEEALTWIDNDAAAPSALDPDVLGILAHELARRVNERLADEIPCLLETALQSALARLQEELKQGVAETTEAAINDFLAERERLAKLQQRKP